MAFPSFTSKFRRSYRTTLEYNRRLEIFTNNYEMIETHNSNKAA